MSEVVHFNGCNHLVCIEKASDQILRNIFESLNVNFNYNYNYNYNVIVLGVKIIEAINYLS